MIKYRLKKFDGNFSFGYLNKIGRLSRSDGDSRHSFFYRRLLIDGKFFSFESFQNINWDQRFALDVI